MSDHDELAAVRAVMDKRLGRAWSGGTAAEELASLLDVQEAKDRERAAREGQAKSLLWADYETLLAAHRSVSRFLWRGMAAMALLMVLLASLHGLGVLS